MAKRDVERGVSSKTSPAANHTATTVAPGPPASLNLTKDAGWVSFQLYSRLVHAMTEISIVDGLVGLYDRIIMPFVLRRTEVLLRVRG